MTLRFRKRETFKSGGYYKWTGGTTHNYQNIIDVYEGCFDDTVTIGDNHEFNALYYSYEGGKYNRNSGGITAIDFTVDHFRNGDKQRGRHAPTGCPSDSALASTALKRATPNKAEIDVPLFVYELRELPDLYQKLRGTPAHKLADLNLRYQFGVAPLLSDLSAIYDLHKVVNKKIKDINRAVQGKDIKKTIKLGDYAGEYTEVNVPLMDRSGSSIYRDVKYDTKLEVKAHVRYKPDASLKLLTEPDIKQLAWRATLGLTVDFNTLWQAMPWSWLIDWVSNVGDLIESSRNIIPCTPYPVAIMKHFVTTVTADGYNWGTYSLTPYKGECDQKFRDKVTPSLSFFDELLSAKQVGILGSIGLLRGTNFHR